jgi:hypothetical protein
MNKVDGHVSTARSRGRDAHDGNPMTASCLRRRSSGTARRQLFSCLLTASILAGCGSPPPPPPPPPVSAEPPPPAKLSDEQVAQCLQPLFFMLFDRAFDPTAVETGNRFFWPSQQSWQVLEGWQTPAGADGANRRLEREWQASASDARTATPSRADVIRRMTLNSGSAEANIDQWISENSNQTVSPLEAVLSMYLVQAIQDADKGNLHRAHVIFSDISAILDGKGDGTDGGYLQEFTRFFADVPDAARYDRTARQLERYSALQEEQLILLGEHASVLKAAGLEDAATFMRDALLTRFDLVTLPMIEAAIARGESYGFRAPSQLTEIKQRLLKLAADVRPRSVESAEDSFRRDAMAIQPDAGYRETFGRFEAVCTAEERQADAGQAEAEGSMEREVGKLWESRRPFGDWLAEKSLCSRNAPFFLVRSPIDEDWLALACPLDADDVLSDSWRDVVRRAADAQGGQSQAILEWCRAGRLDDDRQDGTGHFLLAWFWLEQGRPELARQALLEGGRRLLTRARAGAIDELRLDSQANRGKMLGALRDEINGYRMLAASSQLEGAPPGAISTARDSFVPEINVLLVGWRQSWLKCGFPEAVADAAIDSFRSRTAVATPVRLMPERYHFFDYRFEHGFVPDVVVERAVKSDLVTPPDGTINGTQMVEFINGFRRPRQLSIGAKARWADGGQRPASPDAG